MPAGERGDALAGKTGLSQGPEVSASLEGAGVGEGAAAFKGCVLSSKQRGQQVISHLGDLQRINLPD